MQRIANVLVAGADSELLNTLVNDLAENNFSVLVADDVEEILSEASASQPDLIIIDGSSDTLDGMVIADRLGNGLNTRNIPVVLLDGSATADFYRQALEVGAAETFVGLPKPEEYLRRIRPLLRLSTMRAELQRRADLALGFGVSASIDDAFKADQSPMKILGVALPEATLMRVRGLFGSRCDLTLAANIVTAENQLEDQLFDAVIVGIGDDTAKCLEFCAKLRTNPRLFNLPAIVIGREGEVGDKIIIYRKGATRVFAEPYSDAEFENALVTVVQRQRARWRIRQAIERIKGGTVTDANTGLYTFEFLSEHLKNLISTAAEWNKHLTLAFFSLPTLPNIQRQFGNEAANDLLRQVGQWIKGLIRVEDLTSRHGEHQYAVVFTDTPLQEARVVVNRIAGILSYTDFAIQEVYQPISVTVEVGMTELEAEDNLASLKARALENME